MSSTRAGTTLLTVTESRSSATPALMLTKVGACRSRMAEISLVNPASVSSVLGSGDATSSAKLAMYLNTKPNQTKKKKNDPKEESVSAAAYFISRC